jgi:hypothetical protein
MRGSIQIGGFLRPRDQRYASKSACLSGQRQCTLTGIAPCRRVQSRRESQVFRRKSSEEPEWYCRRAKSAKVSSVARAGVAAV